MATNSFVFVSQPTHLSATQARARDVIIEQLVVHRLLPRTVGVSDFATKNPMYEVALLASHCDGGLILGFGQAAAEQITLKPGTSREGSRSNVRFPSAWNHLEAGILFALRLPLLVIREPGIDGGVFDPGAGEHYVYELDSERIDDPQVLDGLTEAVRSWAGEVWNHYRKVW